MAKKREYGAIHPGIKWGPFTMRIPGVHIGWTPSQLFQGGLLLLATSGSVTPLVMQYFDVSFEVAWTLGLIFLFFVVAQTIFFGDVYAAGAITPALPITLAFVATLTPGVDVIHALTALYLMCALIFLFFGATGLGLKFNQLVPNVLKAGIIMGGAIAAFRTELDRLPTMPFTLVTAWAITLFLLYSLPFKQLSSTKLKIFVAGNAMLVGLVFATGVGLFTEELSFSLTWGFFIPPIAETFSTLSIWSIGVPSWGVFLSVLPLAILIYILAFSDLLIGDTLMKGADQIRKDEKIDVNATRSHYALAARNFLQVITVGPMLWMHGPIWVGVQVFIIERYKQGRKIMDTIYAGPMNFYILAIPLGFLLPVISIITPLFPVALSVALLLTGFACAYVAMSMVEDQTTGGMILIIGMVTAFLGAAWGLGVGLVLYILLIGLTGKKEDKRKMEAEKEIS
ncbi:hypothetical protein MM326_04495 [Alkalihalobacillus sp. LMS6]|uniref:hypothetical protein n=1 Tax=Bacillaceae TaxID=186817 RepID=UPI000C06F2BD|nr:MULTISPECIES: hypothetical protein [Bacillaceae]UTR07297.1 hypothetical protein MM326_04495 [Alkalihalobacillus sp. LMS6]